MSKDNTIIVGNFPEGYRVINSQACENLNSNEYVYPYFKDTTPIEYIDDAVKEANRMEEEDRTEYGIMHIDFQLPLKDYKKLYIGHSISNAVDSTFPSDVMKAINADAHKQSDGIVNIIYDYYSENRTIYHNGYIRDKVLSTEDDLERASHNYCAYIKEANKKELEYKYRELNEQLPDDYHLEVNLNTYSLYYKGDVNMIGTIRDGWFEDVKRRIYEDSI